ncbi:MAG: Nucleotidyl transferase [uncultured bacterium]|nr:MAG: Nucleotidyl transferase [uncultured bacterium]HBY73420.1 nucleotidyltransferase [Candidatus Kerfeldbacteria bacterium]
MTILIPLAGAGSRFAQAGYTDPKPLIPVDGQPMIIRATADLPSGNQWVFICRAEHLAYYPLRQTLEQAYPGCQIIPIDYLTEGQASTCLLAKDYINNEQALLIGACDNGITYHQARWQQLMDDSTVDALIFTFRNNVTVERNPKAYGWVEVNPDQTVKHVSVKMPISKDPIHDHAVVGAFWFRQGKMFVQAAEEMIKKNTRINNEFYVDECMNNAVQLGVRVKVFEIDKYICWGTPNDLLTYNYWQEYFQATP